MTGRLEMPLSGETRRDFIKRSAGVAAVVSGAPLLAVPDGGGKNRKVALVPDPEDATVRETPVGRALARLKESLEARDVAVETRAGAGEASPGAAVVLVASRTSPSARRVLEGAGLSIPDAPEASALVRGRAGDRPVLLASGADARGLAYALLELADRAAHAPDPVSQVERDDRIVEQPANPVRSIARLFTSDVEDKSWYHDRSFWKRYLSMLMAQRFNRFTLTLGLGYNSPRRIRDSYFYFAYPFLVAVPGYDVRAVGLPESERQKNLALLRWLSEEATAVGLHFQLALWTHAYRFRDSPEVNYVIDGLTPENHAAYCRDALHTLLETCPAIAGITFRCHSESGIPERSYEFWRTVYDGVVRAGRKRPIDIHSKGIDHKLIGIALETGMPVSVSPKYWAEHMGLPYHQAAIRGLEFARPDPASNPGLERQRRFTRYGYADYLREGRRYGVLYRIWPGTQRLLLWGDPALAAGYGRYAHICGSLGLELCEPLSFKGRMGSGVPGNRNAYADEPLHPPGGDWEKHLYTYRLWGRMLYDPDTPRECWMRYLKGEFGAAARDCEVALGSASRVLPLITTAHDPSASNNGYWPEIYTNMPIASERSPYGDTPSPKRFGNVSPLDPALFSRVEEFADELITGERSGKHSPIEVARWLDRLARAAERHLARARSGISTGNAASFRRLAVDVSIQAGTARFFAEKFRAALAFAFFEKTHDRAALADAVQRYGAARDAWARMAEVARGVYVDDITFGRSSVLRGHWADRLAAIDEDLDTMKRRARETSTALGSSGKESISWAAVVRELERAGGSRPRCQHLPPAPYRPGEAVTVEMSPEAGHRLASARLHYRHVNQSEEQRVMEMSAERGRFRVVIPGRYTDSVYPLMYFFELHDRRGQVWLHPGFNADLSSQPYFIVRHA